MKIFLQVAAQCKKVPGTMTFQSLRLASLGFTRLFSSSKAQKNKNSRYHSILKACLVFRRREKSNFGQILPKCFLVEVTQSSPCRNLEPTMRLLGLLESGKKKSKRSSFSRNLIGT